MYLRRADGEKIYIDESVPLGQGGEARVYAVSEFPSWAAKVYLDERATPERAAKLAVMRNHPPRVPIGSDDHVPIAWPVELLYDLKNRERVVGFLMPRAYDVVEIIDFYNAQHRLQFNPLFDYRYLLRAARNLAATVRALHARNYIVGDLKHANILATNTALITLVDTDSFQVVDPDTQQIYPCPVRTPEFTPPELQGIATGQEILLPEHDNFGLAVLIFHLLMEGTHPFAGVYEGEDDPPPFEDRIAQGHFPYGANPGPYRPGSRSAPPFSMLPPPIQELFLQCFDAGFADPTVRPTAQEWQNALDEAKRALTHCAENPSHYYSNHLSVCPWCERKVKQLRGVDPFPSEADIDAWQAAKAPNPAPAYPSASVGALAANGSPKNSWSTAVNHPPLSSVAAPVANPDGDGKFLRNLFGGMLGLVGLLFVFGTMMSSHSSSYSSTPCPSGTYSTNDSDTNESSCQPYSSQSGSSSGSYSQDNQGMQNGTAPVPTGKRGVAFSPNGKILVTMSDKTRLWNAKTGELLHTLEWQSEDEYGTDIDEAIVFSPDGKRIAMNRSRRLALYDGQTGLMIKAIEIDHGVHSLAFSPDGKMLAAAMQNIDNPVRLWSGKTLKPLKDIDAYWNVNVAKFSPDGQYLVAGGLNAQTQKGRIVQWDTKNWNDHAVDSAHPIDTIAITHANSLIAAGAGHIDVFYHKLQHTGDQMWGTFPINAANVEALAFSPNGETLLSRGEDNTLRVYDTRSKREVYEYQWKEAEGTINAVFSADSKTMAVGDTRGVSVYNLKTGRAVCDIKFK